MPDRPKSGEPPFRDPSIRMRDRSAKLRERWRSIRDHRPASDLRDDVLAFLNDAAESGESIVSASNREMVAIEIGLWRQWLAAELGEYLDPIDMAPSQVSVDEELRGIDRQDLLEMLQRGETVNGRLVKDVVFANYLTEVSDAFSEAKLINCRFERCVFDGASFGSNTKLVYVAFLECSLNNMYWPRVRASSLVFEDLHIRGARFEGGMFADVLFRNFQSSNGTSFADANFTYCRFEDVEFAGTDFTGAIFSNCVFEGATFTACNFNQAVFSESDRMEVTIAGGSMRDVIFSHCQMAAVQVVAGPPRGGDAARRIQVRPDLSNVRAKTSYNVPQIVIDYMDLEDLGELTSDKSPLRDR
jgi:uncharacterized protein YjbI with pentapeptide repeats